MKQLKQIKKLQRFIKSKIKEKKKIFFFLDFDGVLVAIQNNPDIAYLPLKSKKLLTSLSKVSDFRVGIVSGRTLSKLKKLTRIKSKDIILVGSHGLEMFFKGKTTILFKHDLIAIKRLKAKATKQIKSLVKGFLENKPYTFTYHIRDSKIRNPVKTLSKFMKKLLSKNNAYKNLKVLEGKNIVEVMPKEVNKGKAVEKIIKWHPGYLYMYFGDDITDISAFKATEKYRGISVSLNPNLNYKPNYLINSQKLIPGFIKSIVRS